MVYVKFKTLEELRKNPNFKYWSQCSIAIGNGNGIIPTNALGRVAKLKDPIEVSLFFKVNLKEFNKTNFKLLYYDTKNTKTILIPKWSFDTYIPKINKIENII